MSKIHARYRPSLADHIEQMEFLRNLVKVFPSLASRPLHITGESYAGMYIVSQLFEVTAMDC